MQWGKHRAGSHNDRRTYAKVPPVPYKFEKLKGEGWVDRHLRRHEQAMESLGLLGRAAEIHGLVVSLLPPVPGARHGESGERVRFDLAGDVTGNVTGSLTGAATGAGKPKPLAIWHPITAELVRWSGNGERQRWHVHTWQEALNLAVRIKEGKAEMGSDER